MKARQLKDFFDEGVVRSIARDLSGAYRKLDKRAFVSDCLKGLAKLELMARGGRVAEVMRKHLPPNFEAAANTIVRSLGPELDGTEDFGMAPFRYMPHVLFVGRYGTDHFEASMSAQYQLTKRFSAEFSIRAFLEKHPEATYARLIAWATDPNVHVRRLVSEGSRPRLPWAPRLRAYQKDPRPVLGLLELLKDDPERYVQRSVANNLNDIGKDHPDIATAVCRRWLVGAPPARRWIVRHALRSLLKAGHRDALKTLGFGAAPKIRIGKVNVVPRNVHIGDKLRFSFELTSDGKGSQDLLVDYAVHFVKANGTARPKVFKLRKIALGPSARVVLEGGISFAPMTTRRLYPGLHGIDVLVNGVAHPIAQFQVRR